MIWIGGFGCWDGRKWCMVCFADAEERDCDLVVGWDTTKDIAGGS